MSDHKVLIFGSFTEDETRHFQKQSTKTDVQSAERMGLQFGSLDFASLTSSKGLGAQQKHSSENVQGLKVMEEAQTPENGKAAITKCSHKVPRSEINGIAHGSSSYNGKVSENVKDNFNLTSLSIAEDRNGGADHLTSENVHNACEKVGNSGSSVDVCDDLTSMGAASGTSSQPEEKKLLKILMPRGLINSGNLCFLNATLQALLSCAPFVHLLQDLGNRNLMKAGYPTLLSFVEFISNFDRPDDLPSRSNEKASLESGKPFCPTMFDHVLRKFTPDVPASLSGRPRQEDAQEFLSFVMDQMHDELLKLEGPSLSQNGLDSSLVSSEDDGWETVGPKNKSSVTRTQKFTPSSLSAIFGGQLRSVVKARGNKASATVQPFLLLHLDIHSEAVHTIEDALHVFSAPEALEGYKASAGKAGSVAASKSVKIQELSKVMILHLMRFSYGSKGMAKLHKAVHFPLELVLGRELLVSPLSEGRRYELVATITHHGREPSRGHYTADAKYADGRWLRYDDATVMAVNVNKVLHDQAYVLFYKQV